MKHTISFFYLKLLVLKNIGPREESFVALREIVEGKSRMMVGIIEFFRDDIRIL
jgi:hypothetical protein